MEEWKKLVYPKLEDKYNHYEISTFGRIRNINTGNILKPSLLKSGYLSIRVCTKNRYTKIHIIVHRAMAYTFLNCSSDGLEVNHKDSNRTNNNIDNLELCTSSYNQKYKYDTNSFDKRKISGENNHNSKLTWNDVEYIRNHYIHRSKQFGITAMSKMFNVSKNVIFKVIKNKTWIN